MANHCMATLLKTKTKPPKPQAKTQIQTKQYLIKNRIVYVGKY